jgi:glycosyltransferase involved in cell wall biosynthesis
MKRRLVIVTEIISPYRIPLFNALAEHPGVDLHVIFLAETDPKLRQWEVYMHEIRFSFQVLYSWRKRIGKYNALLNFGVQKALDQSRPDVILCGGYSYIASWQALLWGRKHGVAFLLWSESNLQDLRGSYGPIEFLKKQFLRRCTGFIVPGTSALEYLTALRVKHEKIFTAPNAVDNELFARAAGITRRDAAALRSDLSLPSRYFIFVGRLVREKGIFELLSAYANLERNLRAEIGLVFVGDGQCRQELEKASLSISPGAIKFTGFAQRDQLGAHYALSEALILPTYTDTWGMVVNEAMACGLPVIVSRAAGCAADLVRENWNGSLVDPRDVAGLEQAMSRLALQPELSKTMGAHSAEHIREYSPEKWSNSVARAIQVIAENPQAGCA